MSYVNNTLLPGEKLILMGKIHWIVFANPVILWLIAFISYFSLEQMFLGVVVAIIALVSTGKALAYFFCTELAVTDRRVISKFGFIQRDTFELNVNRVTSLNVDQSMLGRVLNYGDITVIGMGGSLTPVPAIVDPLRFRRVILGEVEGTKLDT